MPDLIEGDIPDDVFTEICAFCGFALRRREVSAYFQGIYVDYDEHQTETGAYFVLCWECRNRVKHAMTCDPEEAVSRRINSGIDCVGDDHR